MYKYLIVNVLFDTDSLEVLIIYTPLGLLNIDIFACDSAGYRYSFILVFGRDDIIIVFSVWHETVHLLEPKKFYDK